jgi:tetratricopeptide (TPR) repeat protein
VLCARLDDLPLAIELAAARSKLLSPAQLIETLGGRLDRFRGGRDVDPRHRTLRTTIEWSHDLLSHDEQDLFARLAVFNGGSTIDAAREICDADEDLLQSLLDKSLVRRRISRSGEPRLWMLETIHEFAIEQFAARPDAEAIRERCARWYSTLALALRPAVREGEKPATEELVDELPNLRATLEWSAASGVLVPGFDVVWALFFLWTSRGLGQESLRWADWVRSNVGALSPSERLNGVLGASEIFRWFGRDADAEALKWDALATLRESGPSRHLGALLSDLADVVARRGDQESARGLALEALDIRRELGDPGGIAHALGALGLVEFVAGNYTKAVEWYREALPLTEQSGSPPDLLFDVLMVGECARRSGDLADAVHQLARATILVAESELRGLLPEVLRETAAVVFDPATGARLLAAADRVAAETGAPPWEPEDAERTISRVRSELGDRFDECWAAGLELTDEDALSVARAALAEV